MTVEIIKFGFVAGELAPAFYGRPDLEKFDFGLARAYNWFVDYRGGLSSRPALRFHEFLMEDTLPIMMFEFRFNTDIGNTYNMIFGHEYIRFVQDGVYITETPKVPTAITKANPGIVTSAGHGFSNGDWLKLDGIGGMTELNGRTVVVAGATANTFQLKDHTGANINTSAYGTFTAGGNLRRVYTVTSPYDAEHVAELCVTQYRDRVDITHELYAPRTLTRTADTNWTLDLTDFGNDVSFPTGLSLTSSDDDSASAIYAVTAVDDEGEEGPQSDPIKFTDGPAIPGSGGKTVDVRWTPVAGAQYYNVYRSTYVQGVSSNRITKAELLGYIGRSNGSGFIDNGITPDFTKTPPVGNNPFAHGAVELISITAQGTGYSQSDTVTVTGGGGSGFRGVLLVNNAGQVIGVTVIDGGSGYSGATAIITTAGGSGAVLSVQLSESSGNWPSLNTVYQQRRIYAASTNDPLSVWGSKPGYQNNFDVSNIVAENDSYDFELDSGDLTPIKHIMSVRGGLLALTETGIWVVNGGGESVAITPINVLADPHTFVGCADVRPIRIDTDLIYVEHKGSTVRELAYNDFSKLYSGNDISILSNHFFSKMQEIQSWAYAADPYKLIWGAKLDGRFLSLTIVKDQKVYAWCEHGTKGFVERFLTIEEDGSDVVYAIVKRFVNGRWSKYLESMSTRQIEHVEDAIGSDSCLTLGATYPAANIMASAASDAVTFTASTPIFTSGDVGKILRMAGGKAEITAYTDTTHVSGIWIRDPTKLVPETDDLVVPASAGDWTLDTGVSSVGGLWHLEGETVQILADGNTQPDQVVTNGRITLDYSPTRVCVGLKFASIARSLPLTITGQVIEGQRKRIPQLAVRQLNSRGLQIGRDLEHLYDMKERTDEPAGEPTNLQSGMRLLSVQPKWEEGGQIYFYRDDPTPVSILGYVTSTEVGDDPD